MICPDCQKGMVKVVPHEGGAVRWLPCPRCNGSGIAYCCDGEDYLGAPICSNPEQKQGSVPI